MIQKNKPGRPHGTFIEPSNRYVPLSVRIPQYVRDQIDRVSACKDQTRSITVLEAIDDYLFNYRNMLGKYRKLHDD